MGPRGGLDAKKRSLLPLPVIKPQLHGLLDRSKAAIPTELHRTFPILPYVVPYWNRVHFALKAAERRMTALPYRYSSFSSATWAWPGFLK
jgi:hypothetical protein